jgi:hypothetical protein
MSCARRGLRVVHTLHWCTQPLTLIIQYRGDDVQLVPPSVVTTLCTSITSIPGGIEGGEGVDLGNISCIPAHPDRVVYTAPWTLYNEWVDTLFRLANPDAPHCR